MAEKKIKWQWTEKRPMFGKTVVWRARMSRSGIIVQGEIEGSEPRLWTEWEMPKVFGLLAATDQTAIQSKLEDFKP